jgi:glyoxylase-like metal-dependent hydrolase (beta-lactamase superfamily II)
MEYKIFKPYSYLYHLRDPLGVNFTIITGSEKAIVFDTGYGFSDITEVINKIVKTPYIVINSHGHMDHTCGNYLFKEVYIHPKDRQLCINSNSRERRSLNIQIAKKQGLLDESFGDELYINQGYGKLVNLNDNQIFNLGDLHVRVVPMPGHTQGSIGLLVEETRLLLSGDAAISMIWLFLKESTSKDEYIKMLERVIKEPFDNFITGHISRVFPKVYFDYYIKVAMTANISNSQPISFAGFERPNTYQYKERFNDDIIGICFHEESIMNEFIQNEVNRLKINNYQSIDLIRSKDGIHVYKIYVNNQHYILKCIEKEEYRREIKNYLVLQSLGIKTITLIAHTDCSLLMEDITYSDQYRLGVFEDLDNLDVITQLAQWYKRLHTLGIDYINKYGSNMYMESDCFTLDNIELIMKTTKTEHNIVWDILKQHFDDLLVLINKSIKTLNYNDFYYTNLIVAKDYSEAFMFDYNILGKGNVASDLRNVTVKLSDKLKKVFLIIYGEYDHQEMLMNDIVGTVVALYFASSRPIFPEWGYEVLEDIESGKLLKTLKTLFS